jgi:hypothetical protein
VKSEEREASLRSCTPGTAEKGARRIGIGILGFSWTFVFYTHTSTSTTLHYKKRYHDFSVLRALL